MENTRLHLLDKDLAKLITDLNEIIRHKLIVSICRLAIKESELQNPLAEQSLKEIKEGKYNNQKLKQKLLDLTEELDEMQWDLSEKMELNNELEQEQTKIFKQARAANTLLIAITNNSLETALESVYESIAATDNINIIKKAVNTLAH